MPLIKTPLFSVVGLLMQDGLVLAVSRKTDHEDLGLPGGKIDPGEAALDALDRELREEVGTGVLSAETVFEDLDRVEGAVRKPCRTYRVTSWVGVPQSREGAWVGWVPPSRLLEPSCSFRDYNRRLFDAIGLRY